MSMSSFDEESTPNARRPIRCVRRVQTIFDLPAAMERLPLVRLLVRDLVDAEADRANARVALRRAEIAGRDSWDDKKARFALTDQHETARKRVKAIRSEIEQLGLSVLDVVAGTAGFPTIVNGALAHLVFRLEDDGVKFWCYRDEQKLRAIPETWLAEAEQVPAEECEGLLV